MKKHLRRFLCFFLCFCLFFAYFGETQKAEAAGVGLAGIVLMYLLGCGFGFSVSGASTHLAEGITELTKEFIDHGQENIWEAIEAGVTVTEAGVLLFDKVATDALNSFMNWLQTDKGWTEGEINQSESGYFVPIEYGTITVNNVLQPIKLISNSSGTPYTRGTSSSSTTLDNVNLCGTLVPYPLGFTFNAGSNTVASHCIEFGYKDVNGVPSVYLQSTDGSSSISIANQLKNMRCTIDQFAGVTFFLNSGTSYLKTQNRVGIAFVKTDGSYYIDNSWVIIETSTGSLTDFYEYLETGYTVSVPSDLTAPDTSDWDASTSLGLFNGHSGKIPTSVEEYNDLVLQDINSGVIPEVTTDVIVGIPDQVLPDEDDGTLAGTVSGILAQVKALPQTLANLVLDGVKSIFIPDPSSLETEFMGVLDEVNEKYKFDFDLGSLFGQGVEPEDIKAVYHVGDKDFEMTFVSWHYLKDAVIYFRPYIRGFIVLMLLYYNLRQFMAIFGLGGVMNGDSGDNRRNDLAV